MILTNIRSRLNTDWTDFVVKDQNSVDTEINLQDMSATDTIKLVTLNMSRYNGYLSLIHI